MKEPKPGRKDDPYLGKRLIREKEGILNWAMEGLMRLIANDFEFYISPRAQENMRRNISDSVNIPEFLDSGGYVSREETGNCTNRQLYSIYCDWCRDNCAAALSAKTFVHWLRQNEQVLGLAYTHNIPIGNGKTARGFRGIRACSRF